MSFTIRPLTVRPLTRDEANAFVRSVHRHNGAVAGWKFGSGLYASGQLVGVGIAGRCSSRVLDKRGGGHWIEVSRVATDGTANGCSKLYGALTRAAAAIGYCRAYTYTLASESGASLKASGWQVDAHLRPRKGWDTPSRRRDNDRTPGADEPRIRWVKYLDDCADHAVVLSA